MAKFLYINNVATTSWPSELLLFLSPLAFWDVVRLLKLLPPFRDVGAVVVPRISHLPLIGGRGVKNALHTLVVRLTLKLQRLLFNNKRNVSEYEMLNSHVFFLILNSH
jgi:hypothetical protein